MRSYFVYIVTNATQTVLYVGVTNNLHRRLFEHSHGLNDGFTKKYKCTYLLYFEETDDVEAAIAREKQIKKWNRAKKEALIDTINKAREDLSTEPVLSAVEGVEMTL